MRHWLIDLVAWQDRWARPFGEFNHRWLSALFRPIRPVKDFLNGSWLGHPIHPAVTDVPIGAFIVALVLDLVGQADAALVAIVVGVVTFVAALVTGLADYTDTDGTARARATTHGTIMFVAGLVTALSMFGRISEAVDPTITTALLVIGLVLLLVGAFVGGDLVFVFGNMVSRHAFRGAGTKWIALDTGGADLAELPESTPTKMRAGINDLVDRPDRRHASMPCMPCAPTPADRSTRARSRPDGCIECPWHASRFRLDGWRPAPGPDGLRPAGLRGPVDRDGATRSVVSHAPARRRTGCQTSPSRIRSSSCSSGRPGQASPRSPVACSPPTRSCRPMPSAQPSPATRRTSGRRDRRSRPSGRRLERRFAARQRTVIDATNVRASDRASYLAAARRHGIPVAAIVLDLPRAVVLARNAGRERVVDEAVIDRHIDALRQTLDRRELEREGVDPIIVLRTPEAADALVLTAAA